MKATVSLLRRTLIILKALRNDLCVSAAEQKPVEHRKKVRRQWGKTAETPLLHTPASIWALKLNSSGLDPILGICGRN